MSDSTEQNFENHSRFPTAYVIIALMVLVSAIGIATGFVARGTDWGPAVFGVSVIALAVAVLLLHTVSRFPLLMLQDRIIRLESEVRCERLLPEDLKERARGLTLAQRVASRFASDEEFPDLIRRVLDEDIQNSKTIKQSVKNWQADHKRI